MKIQYDFTKFKACLKRNAGKKCDLFYRGEMISCARVWYVQTKKALITFNPSNRIQSSQVCGLALSLGYVVSKYEDIFVYA